MLDLGGCSAAEAALRLRGWTSGPRFVAKSLPEAFSAKSPTTTALVPRRAECGPTGAKQPRVIIYERGDRAQRIAP